MISNVLNTTLITLIIVLLLHGIYLFLKQNLTTPVVHDLINKPAEKYNEIETILKTQPDETPLLPSFVPQQLPPDTSFDKKDMKYDLKNYLKTLTTN